MIINPVTVNYQVKYHNNAPNKSGTKELNNQRQVSFLSNCITSDKMMCYNRAVSANFADRLTNVQELFNGKLKLNARTDHALIDAISARREEIDDALNKFIDSEKSEKDIIYSLLGLNGEFSLKKDLEGSYGGRSKFRKIHKQALTLFQNYMNINTAESKITHGRRYIPPYLKVLSGIYTELNFRTVNKEPELLDMLNKPNKSGIPWKKRILDTLDKYPDKLSEKQKYSILKWLKEPTDSNQYKFTIKNDEDLRRYMIEGLKKVKELLEKEKLMSSVQ